MEKKVIDEDGGQDDYFKMSIVSFFFCPVFGLISIWKSSKCRKRLRQGDDDRAELAALDSLKWAMTSLAIGGSFYFIVALLAIYYLVVFYFGGADSPFIDFQ